MTPVGKLALIKTFDKSELLKAMNFAIIPALSVRFSVLWWEVIW
jgi:hypothetical protein